MASWYSNYSNGYRLFAEAYEASYDIASNTSVVNWRLYLCFPGKYFSGKVDSGYFYSYGQYLWTPPSSYSFSAGNINSNYELGSGAFVVSHDSEGKATIHIEAAFAASSGGWGPGLMTIDTYLTLTTIPRASTHTLISGNKVGEELTFRLNRKHSSYTDTVSWRYDDEPNTWHTVGSGLKDTFKITVPNDGASHSTNANKLKIWIRNQTYNGSSTIGNPFIDYWTLFIPDTIKPSINYITVTPVEKDGYSWNKFIQGKCKVRIDIGASGIYGSTINMYKLQHGNDIFQNENGTFVTDKILNPGTLNFLAQVQDSRGIWSGTNTKTVEVLPYFKPIINEIEVYRCTNSGVADEKGAYYSIRVYAGHASCDGDNSLNITCRHKQSASSYYGNSITLSNNQKKIIGTISKTNSYDVEITATDIFSNKDIQVVKVRTESVAFNIMEGNKGAAVGKYAEYEDTFENGYKIFRSEEVISTKVKGENIDTKTLNVGNIDYTITEEEYATLIELLGE